MKFNVFAGLLVAATFGFFASNAGAQDAIVAQDAAQTAAAPVGKVVLNDCDECNECVPVVGSGALRGRLGAGVGAVRGGFGAAALRGRGEDFRKRLENRLYVRDIVEASPFATPSGEPGDWARFRYYPYGYYPHNFNAGPAGMQVPKYNPAWQNYYPVPRRFHEGKHFILDVF